MEERLILVCNDDGIHAPGIEALIETVKPFGKVLVVAPSEGQSGMSHAITIKVPLRIHRFKNEDESNVERYICSGTPVDCVKLALSRIAERKPDLIVSGINHGGNSSASIVYSGTMAAAMEGCVNGIPSIGFSLLDVSREADFSVVKAVAREIIYKVLSETLPDGVCLNVNVPQVPLSGITGIRICRQTKGFWIEEFDKRTDPNRKDYYWLTGLFQNLEPDAIDTDEWALMNNYVSIVPVKIDLTSYDTLAHIKHWESEMIASLTKS
jgi:5'-nucleotidase